MFLTRMVSGFICSKQSTNENTNNPNQQQQQQQTQQHPTTSKSGKPNRKTVKCKNSLSKTNSKKSVTELVKTATATTTTAIKQTPTAAPAPAPPTTASSNNNNNNNSSGNNNNNNNNNNNSNSSNSNKNSNNNNNNNSNNNSIPVPPPATAASEAPTTSKASSSTLKPPTKVKSGSWKRSEKQISSYNGISATGKKTKSQRKRSPTWLKFPNNPVDIAERVSYVSPADTTSVCRPGTLYSDVLFGAGSSCLVKIKTLTARRSVNAAQKKLTKALVRCARNENDTSGSETETDHELFPSLNADANNKSLNSTIESENNSQSVASTKSDDEPDVVILSETPNSMCGVQNGIGEEVSYGNYLEQHFKQLNGNNNNNNMLMPKPAAKPFTIDIPQWNFLDADMSTDAYPKFLCQFEDEHYLKAEKMALLGLKLAMGNGNYNSQQGRFKF